MVDPRPRTGVFHREIGKQNSRIQEIRLRLHSSQGVRSTDPADAPHTQPPITRMIRSTSPNGRKRLLLWRRKNTFHSGYQECSPYLQQQLPPTPNRQHFQNKSERLTHRLKVVRNKVFMRNPQGSFSYFHGEPSQQSSSPQLLDRSMTHQRSTGSKQSSQMIQFSPTQPTRISKEEIETMSDNELAFLIRQQEVQVDRIAGGGIVVSRSPAARLQDQQQHQELYNGASPQQHHAPTSNTSSPAGDPILYNHLYASPTGTPAENGSSTEHRTHASSPHTEKKTEHRVLASPSGPLATMHRSNATLQPPPSAMQQPSGTRELQPSSSLRPQPQHDIGTKPSSSFSSSSTPYSNFPSLDANELTLLRSQLAQSLGREDFMRERINKLEQEKNSTKNTNNTHTSTANTTNTTNITNTTKNTKNTNNANAKDFQEAVVECIEELNTELDFISQGDQELAFYHNDAYNNTLTYMDQLILQAKSNRISSPSKQLHNKAMLSTIKQPTVQQKRTATPPHVLLSLSRGICSLSEYANPLLPSVVASVQQRPSFYAGPPSPFRSDPLPVPLAPPTTQPRTICPSLGMDRHGNITVF